MSALVTYELLRTGIHATRQSSIDWTPVSEDQRWWIGGQVDADGCVRVCPVNGPMVRVGKAEKGWSCLEWLQTTLGGAIYKGTRETERHQAQREWCIRGQAALDFCSVIKSYSYLKRPQMEKTMEFPLYGGAISQLTPVLRTSSCGEETLYASIKQAAKCNRIGEHIMFQLLETGSGRNAVWKTLENPITADYVKAKRQELESVLKEMKKTEHTKISGLLQPPYAAGFADGEACFDIGSIQVGQKYRAICDALQLQYGGRVRKRKDKDAYNWEVYGNKARNCLQDIAPHLIEKREQANLILNLQAGCRAQVKASLRLLKGNQGRRNV